MLYHGDNLEVMRREIPDAVVDLCYIDPPFHSGRNYTHARTRQRVFTDVWTWDQERARELEVNSGRTGVLLRAFRETAGEGGLLAYLSAMAPRIEEIHRTLKPAGTFFLHCDPTASHYLKLLCDAVFVPAGGGLRNEIVWCYSHGGRSKRRFGRKHDIILFYSKSSEYTFNEDALRIPMRSGKHSFGGRLLEDESGRKYRLVYGTKNGKGETRYYKYFLDDGKLPEDWWTDINSIQATSGERLGFPTQKPEALLRRILLACTNPGDLVLDAFCGSGTTLVAAQQLRRNWIGIDSSREAVATVEKRLLTGGGHQPRR